MLIQKGVEMRLFHAFPTNRKYLTLCMLLVSPVYLLAPVVEPTGGWLTIASLVIGCIFLCIGTFFLLRDRKATPEQIAKIMAFCDKHIQNVYLSVIWSTPASDTTPYYKISGGQGYLDFDYLRPRFGPGFLLCCITDSCSSTHLECKERAITRHEAAIVIGMINRAEKAGANARLN